MVSKKKKELLEFVDLVDSSVACIPKSKGKIEKNLIKHGSVFDIPQMMISIKR